MTLDSTTSYERLLAQFLQSLPDPAMVSDLQGSIEFVNSQMLKLVGLTEDQVVGQAFPYPWMLPKEKLDRLPWVNQGREFEGAAQVESLVTDSEGNHRIIRFSITALQSAEGQPNWLLSIGRDITPQSEAEELFNAPGMELAGAVEDMPAWVQLMQLDGTIEAVNDAACAISGYDRSEMIGQTWPYPWFPEGWQVGNRDPFAELNLTGQGQEFAAACLTRSVGSRVLDVSISLVYDEERQPRRVLMVAQDITERRQWEEQLVQAEKIGAVNQLASGVAHDINNDLAVILGYSEFLLGKSNHLDDTERYALGAIQQQARECAETVRRIQVFSRPVHPSKFSYCSINDVAREAVKTAENRRRSESTGSWSGIRFETDLQWVPRVLVHVDSLNEAVTSLVNNAIAALPEDGTVTLHSRRQDGEVVLEVADDGVGIDPVDMRRIFEPFFTTKGPASSGLGLAIAYNLVTQMGGTLTAESEPGTGTTLIIRFPAASDDLAAHANTGEPVTMKQGLDVMVVEDEPLVAGLFRTFLESMGHRVSVYLDGAEAVEAFEKSQSDLALVDLGLPGMDGWEVSRRINDILPETPIIVATGWNITVEDGQEQGAAVNAVLRKPFTMGELAAAIEDVSRRSHAGTSN